MARTLVQEWKETYITASGVPVRVTCLSPEIPFSEKKSTIIIIIIIYSVKQLSSVQFRSFILIIKP